ncbi:MAG TPA: HAMP domain-containing sensor histidine kinase [Nitriliruptorales bacterium]|nr:HAMP domain-containing sensor histidine kinase [Nitriliruptorales bacterium]
MSTTLSLVSSSAVLVHLSGGYIELHFHFFVVVALVTLYQQWNPFLLAIGFVALHHGIAGVIDPTSVFNHPSALSHPWRWAGIHAAFIAMASAVGMANWKLNELARHRAEHYFQKLYEGEHALVQRLQETDRVKGELVAAVSHEFRTPLTAILGFAQTLQRNPQVPSEQVADFAARVLRQGHRLHQLVQNLLEAEKPLDETGGACDAEAVIRSSLATAAAVDRVPDRTVLLDIVPGVQVPLRAAATELVLTNLLDNAIKFSTPGTPLTVRAYQSPGGEATIEVANHGPAVSAELRERIFQPFVQGDSSSTRAADGVALGLHIVLRVVPANHGRVEVDSHDGVTVFTVTLPEPHARPARMVEQLPGPPRDSAVGVADPGRWIAPVPASMVTAQVA